MKGALLIAVLSLPLSGCASLERRIDKASEAGERIAVEISQLTTQIDDTRKDVAALTAAIEKLRRELARIFGTQPEADDASE